VRQREAARRLVDPTVAPEAAAENGRLRERVAYLEAERDRLWGQVGRLQDRIRQFERGDTSDGSAVTDAPPGSVAPSVAVWPESWHGGNVVAPRETLRLRTPYDVSNSPELPRPWDAVGRNPATRGTTAVPGVADPGRTCRELPPSAPHDISYSVGRGFDPHPPYLVGDQRDGRCAEGAR
jgi:hypothetical protein